MPIQSIISSLRDHTRTRTQRNDVSCAPNTSNLGARLAEVFSKTWDLGFTAFGGPPVHFQILHRRFVEGLGFNGSKWIDEQTVNPPKSPQTTRLFHLTTWLKVSRTLRNMPSPARPRIHKNGILHRNDTRWPRRSAIRFLIVVVAWCDWYVRAITRCAENAGSLAADRVCAVERDEC